MAQTLTISGKIIDVDTQEGLPFASIGILGKPFGTISNASGEFDFHLPIENRNEMLTVSMLGYRNYEAPVWSLLDGEVTIKLEKSLYVLQEIVVSDSLTGGDILRTALNRIENNYPMQPFELDGFYRDVKKVGGSYISLLEAAVKIYDDDYREPRNKFRLRERVELMEVRQSLGYESKFTTFFDQTNLLEDLLTHNNIRYRQFDASDEFFRYMNREKDSYYDGREIFVVSHSEAFKLKVYIDKADFSILRLEYETGPSNDIVGKRKDMISRFAGLKKTIDFKRYDGKMYLNFMSIVSKVNWHDNRTNELKFETELDQQLLINHITPNTTNWISTTAKMKNYGLQLQNRPYNKTFWDNYNVIKETPLDKKILEDLERVGRPLERQFEEN